MILQIEWIEEHIPKSNIISIDLTNLKFEELKEYHALNNYIEDRYDRKKENYIFVDECVVADDGVKAIHAMNCHQFDLVLLDVMLPYIDGISVCKVIRERSMIPIIFMTAKNSEEEKLSGYDVGCNDYITKPISLKILVAKIRVMLLYIGLFTVSKKIMLIAKTIGIMTMMIYFVSLNLSAKSEYSIILIIVFSCAMILLMHKILCKVIHEPLVQIIKVAEKMANIDFTITCKIKSQDEVGKLGKIINNMSSNLDQTLQELQECNRKLEIERNHVTFLLNQRKDWVDMISHDLKTPLGVVKTYGEGLKGEMNGEEIEKYSQTIVEAVDEMSSLITSLLDLSALESGLKKLEIVDFDFIDVLDTMVGKLLVDIPDKNFQLEYDVPRKKLYISGDKKRMEQVLSNLFSNSKKYVKENGNIKIELIEQNGMLNLAVMNNGEFIHDLDLEKLCMKFYRGKCSNHKEGNGLGLSIISKILDLHGFKFSISCNEGLYIFRILIPTRVLDEFV